MRVFIPRFSGKPMFIFPPEGKAGHRLAAWKDYCQRYPTRRWDAAIHYSPPPLNPMDAYMVA